MIKDDLNPDQGEFVFVRRESKWDQFVFSDHFQKALANWVNPIQKVVGESNSE